MYKIKSLALVALAILFGGIFVSGAAQRRMPPAPFVPPLPSSQTLSGTYRVDVTANELSTGDIEFTTGETYGWTCYGTTEGDLSGFMFVSLNYSSPQPPLGGEIGEIAGGVSKVTGGSWSKLIFIKGVYAGSVYGKIVDGELVWNAVKGNLTATISLQLTSDEGTGSFVGNVGSGTFEGILDQSSQVASVSGKLTLNY